MAGSSTTSPLLSSTSIPISISARPKLDLLPAPALNTRLIRGGRSKPKSYVDLGKNSPTITGVSQNQPPAGPPTVVTGRLDILDTMWIVRAVVNYKFGG